MEQEEDKEEEKSVQEKKPYFTQFTIKTVVYLTSLLIFGSISMAFYCNYEGWSPGTAFGFAVVTLSTVGYGYNTPSDDKSRLFSIFFMLFGVYFVFAGLNEVIALHMEYVTKNMKKEKTTAGENYLAAKKRFAMNILIILAILLVGALGFMACEEDWTFIKALYFSVETITTIGYGELTKPQGHTHAFLCLYILVSAGLMTYCFSNLNLMKAGVALLDEDEKRTKKRRSLEFLVEMDRGAGVSRAEFLLAILEQQGVIDAERDIEPWNEKFNLLDIKREGRVYRRELEIFHRQEAELADSHLNEIQRDRSSSIASITTIPILNAAERILQRSPWTSMDEGHTGGGSSGGRLTPWKVRSNNSSQDGSGSDRGGGYMADARAPMLGDGNF